MRCALDTLASFAARVTLSAMPEALRAHAPWVLLDVVGAALAGGAQKETGALLASILARPSTGPATVLQRGFPRTTPQDAAWLNGISAVWLELDPGHRHFRTHAPAHVMPVALAEAQSVGASGAELLTAFIVGCEVACRVGGATTPRAEVNAHGTWGITGAAAAAARLRGLDEVGTTRALRIAAQLPIATSFQTSLQGATVRHGYVGATATLAMQAVSLAQAGFSALDDAASETFGRILGTAFDSRVLTQGLGENYEFMRDFAKLHACCHHLYPAVDALDDVLRAHPHEAGDVQRIMVDTYAVAARLCNPAPANELAARFSLPFGLAARVIGGAIGPQAFRSPALDDPRVRALATRIEVRADPALSARFPRERPARVQVLFTDGTNASSERHATEGDYLHPLTHEQRLGKFDALAAEALPATTAHALRQRLLHIEQLRDCALLFDAETADT